MLLLYEAPCRACGYLNLITTQHLDSKMEEAEVARSLKDLSSTDSMSFPPFAVGQTVIGPAQIQRGAAVDPTSLWE